MVNSESIQKNISYSQYSMWKKCPKQWALQYRDGHKIYKPSVHTVFVYICSIQPSGFNMDKTTVFLDSQIFNFPCSEAIETEDVVSCKS